MATRHGCALSREPRSLPLLFLKSGKRIFKPRFGRNSACERIAEIPNRGQFGIGVYARIFKAIGKYIADDPVQRIWKAFDRLRMIVVIARGKYVRGREGERRIGNPPRPTASLVVHKSGFAPRTAVFLRKEAQP
jgi:hypothetical protein